MLKDAQGNEVREGGKVRILKVDAYWFDYLPKDAYEALQDACRKPLRVDYLDEEDGDLVGNSLSIKACEVQVV
tara:strand:- start:8510 stop:8728 length:219 start_codon:yes stop_codon:yes gene_type:complete